MVTQPPQALAQPSGSTAGNSTMAPATKPTEAAAAPAPAGASRASFWHSLLTPRWLLAILVVSLLGHGAVLAVVTIRRAPNGAVVSPEVSLGSYHFVAVQPPPGGVREAMFHLHGTLADPASSALRATLEGRRFLVRESVEQLLRRAKSQDFADPTLAELKRQLQEAINQAVGIKTISGVIVTDLVLKRDHWEQPATDEAHAR